MYLSVVQLAHCFGHAPDAFVDVVARFRNCRTNRSLEFGRFRDDVGRGSGDDLADSDYRGVHGVGLARYERLQRRYQQCSNDDGIDCLVRACAMAAFAPDRDAEAVRLRRHGAFPDHDLAGWPLLRNVTRENGAHVLQGPGIDHHARASAAFLGRLENEHDIAVGRLFRQQRRGSQDHGHVCVMAAGMHAVWVERPVARIRKVAAG